MTGEKKKIVKEAADNKYQQAMVDANIPLPGDKADFTHVMELIEELEKNGLVVEIGPASCDCEPIIKTKDGKFVGHIGIRSGCWYALERGGRTSGRYLRISDKKVQDAEIKALLEISVQVEKRVVKKPAPKKSKDTKIKSISTVEEFEKKIESLDKKAKFIHLTSLADNIKALCDSKNYPIVPDASGFQIKVR